MTYLVAWYPSDGPLTNKFGSREDAERWIKTTLVSGTRYTVSEIIVEGTVKQSDQRLLREYNHRIKFIVTDVDTNSRFELAAFNTNGHLTLHGLKSRNYWSNYKFDHSATVQDAINKIMMDGHYSVEVVDG